MRRWLILALFLASAYFALDGLVLRRPIMRGSGVSAPDAPLQSEMEDGAALLEKHGFRMRPLAAFELEARVLRTERYWGFGADRLSPVDVAFGWGRMSDEAVLDELDIDQYGRFYFWRYEGSPPIPRREIEMSSANMHLIPATDEIDSSLKKLRTGYLVKLRGYLVEARNDDGFVWRSSLSRADTGNHACELIWVEELEAS